MIDALVTGRSLPALQTALDLAEVGLRVAVASPSGLEGTDPVEERDPEGVFAAFLTRISQSIDGGDAPPNSGVEPVRHPPVAPMLRGPKGEWLPQPEPEVLGIPAVPMASEAIALIGSGAATRAYLDRVKPLLTVGKTRALGRLVRTRMGATVLDRLVEPQVFDRYGISADEVDAAIAAPGLNEALSRAGALSSAVLAYSERHVARETRVASIRGVQAMRLAIMKRLELYGVELLDAPVLELEETLEGWIAVLEGEQHLEARAVVFDQGRSPRTLGPMAEFIVDLLPARSRVYAEIEIPRPEWLAEGRSALLCVDGWSARLVDGSGPTVDVRLGSEAFRDAEESDRRTSEVPAETLDALAEAVAGSSQPDAGWRPRAAELVAAPYATIVERDGAVSALETAVFSRDTLLPVGRALHGDDLGAALVWARDQAVGLRRRLLGLDDAS